MLSDALHRMTVERDALRAENERLRIELHDLRHTTLPAMQEAAKMATARAEAAEKVHGWDVHYWYGRADSAEKIMRGVIEAMPLGWLKQHVDAALGREGEKP
jgi:hypothetical protein